MTRIVTDDSIVYTTDGIGREYAKDLYKNRDRVGEVLERWELLAWESLDEFRAATPEERAGLQAAIELEHKKIYSGNALAGSVMMPAPMLHIELRSMRLCVPFGLVYRRMIEAGVAKVVGGRFVVEDE